MLPNLKLSRFSDGESLSYGEYYYCELLGYGLVSSVMVMMVAMYLTLRQLTAISAASSYFVLRKLRSLNIRKRTVILHFSIFAVGLLLSTSTLGKASKLRIIARGLILSMQLQSYFSQQNLSTSMSFDQLDTSAPVTPSTVTWPTSSTKSRARTPVW